jgi:hypothetical protein
MHELHWPSNMHNGGLPTPATHSSAVPQWRKFLSRAALFVCVFMVLFAVMMWDMRKAHYLSHVIHDDHAELWTAVSTNELRIWWSPLDLCMMEMSGPLMEYGSYRDKNCTGLTGSKGARKLHLSCGAGSSIGGSACEPPLDSRWYFKAALKYDGLGDPQNQLLKTALRHSAVRNRPVVFVGDGIAKQNQEALLCEILRTDDVLLSGYSGNIDGNYTVHWRHRAVPPLNVQYMKLTAMNDNGVPKETAEQTAQRRRRLQTKRNSHRPHLNQSIFDTSIGGNISTLPDNTTDNTTVIAPLSLTLDEIKERVHNLMLHHPSGIVLMVNVGVWYNSRELFRTELPELLSWMDGLSRNRNCTVFFRETAAQHWNHTESGYFDQSYIERQYDNGTCTPVLDATPGECSSPANDTIQQECIFVAAPSFSSSVIVSTRSYRN